jgi:glycosyltransferase involved in cell wall biosynthesis
MSGRVLQLLSGAGPYDAVTNQALSWQEMFGRWGWESDVFAANFDPRLDGAVRPAELLPRAASREDVLIVHYSAHARAFDAAAAMPQRKLLVYHNITPARYLWDHEPYVAMLCALGRERLSRFSGRVDAAVAPSAFSAEDLRAAGFADVRVEPAIYLFDRERLRLGAGEPSAYAGDGRRTVVFVGRLSHNKRQDRLVKAFALHQRECDPQARLVLAGSPGSGTYGDYLGRLAEEAGARDVVLPGALPQREINALYGAADVFCCLSEHEGFCIPLLEALHFGLPVVARRAAAVPEVLGDAGVLLDDPDLPTVSEAIELAATSSSLRDELRTRGARRLEAFTPERTAVALRETVSALL